MKAIDLVIASGSPEAAERVAAECVVLAETQDLLRELVSEMSDKLKGEARQVLKKAAKKVEAAYRDRPLASASRRRQGATEELLCKADDEQAGQTIRSRDRIRRGQRGWGEVSGCGIVPGWIAWSA